MGMIWAPSLDTKLAHITLPVAPRHEVPMKKCHCSYSHQSFRTSPVLAKTQGCCLVARATPPAVRGEDTGAAKVLPSTIYFVSGSLCDVMGWCGAAAARASPSSENPSFHHYRLSVRPSTTAGTAQHPPALFTGIPCFWLFTSFS